MIATARTVQHERSVAGPRGPNWPLRIAALLSCVYVYTAFIPFEFRSDGWTLPRIWHALVRPPFYDRPEPVLGLYFSPSNAVVNFSAGLLLGACAMAGWVRPIRWAPVAALLAVAQSFLTAVAMEVVQVGVVGRVPTPTDVVTISLGGLLGAALYPALLRPLAKRLRPSEVFQRRAVVVAVMLLGAYSIHSLFPTRIAASFGEIAQNAARANLLPLHRPGLHLAVQLRYLGFPVDDTPFRHERFHQELTPAQYAASLTKHGVFFVGLATAISAALRSSALVSFPLTLLAVTTIAGLAEALQVFFPPRWPDVNVVLVAASAAPLGFVTKQLLRAWPRLLPLVVLALGVSFAAAEELRPGSARIPAKPLWGNLPALTPGYSLERSSHRVELVLNVFEAVAMQVPVGWAIATLWQRRRTFRSSVIAATLGAALVAMAIEIAQPLVHRTPSIDAVLLAAVGGAVGAWLTRFLPEPVRDA